MPPLLHFQSTILSLGWNGLPKNTAPSIVPAKKRKRRQTLPSSEEDFTNLARSLTLQSWPKIIQVLIDKAVKGGYQHTRLLFDLCGISKINSKRMPKEKKEQLSDALLAGLQVYMQHTKRGDENPRKVGEKPMSQDGHE